MPFPTLDSVLGKLMQWVGSVGALLVLGAAPVAAAERIEFFIGPGGIRLYEGRIWVEDLEALAADGTVTPRFRTVAHVLGPDQLAELRTFLNTPLDVDLVTLSQFTYWQVGERFLDRMGQVVQTNSFQNGSRALRAALLAAAADGDGVTPLEVMQEFPLEVIQLDVDLLRQVAAENRRFFGQRDTLLAQLRAQGEQEAVELPAVVGDPTAPGPYRWEQRPLTFTNAPREGDIPFDVYLPQTDATNGLPVVVFSHGVASGRGALIYVAEHLASHGYAVAVPQHDDDSQKYQTFLAGAGRPPNPITLVTRPRDISQVLDELERQAQTDPALARLDLNNVGVLGHSLGGYTVLAAAGAELNFERVAEHCSLEERNLPSLNPSLLVQCDLGDLAEEAPFALRDPRIQAAIALSPPTSLFFGETGLGSLTVPTLVLATTADIVVPAVPEQIEPYSGLQMESRYLVVLGNATHFTPLQGRLTEGALPLPSTLLGPNPQRVRPYLQALSLGFFQRHLAGQPEAEGILSQAYLDSLGTDPFVPAIVRDWP